MDGAWLRWGTSRWGRWGVCLSRNLRYCLMTTLTVHSMDDEDERARYVVIHHLELLTQLERRALGHLWMVLKSTHGRSDLKAQAEAQGDPDYSELLSTDSEVMNLAANGYDVFLKQTAARLLAEQGDKVFLNHCPECGGLARTPKAKQCRFCGHDWH